MVKVIMMCNIEDVSDCSENLDYRMDIPIYNSRQGTMEDKLNYESILNEIDLINSTCDMNLD